LQANYSWNPRLCGQILDTVRRTRFDIIHVEHLRGARYGVLLTEWTVRQGFGRTPVVWDSVDSISALCRETARRSSAFLPRLVARLELGRTERYEGHLAGYFDRVLVTSSADRSELLRLARAQASQEDRSPVAKRIIVLPNGVDLDYFTPSGEEREPLRLVISGKMSYHANVTSVVHFVQKVMPAIWAWLPNTKLWIVGKDPPDQIRRLGVTLHSGGSRGSRPIQGDSRIQITGLVDDIRPFLRRASVAVAPIQYGVGIQNKVLEALACGTPTVASPQAVAALKVMPGKDVIVADWEDFAETVVALLHSPAQRYSLGLAGRQYVVRQHDWKSIVGRLTDIYQDTIDHPPPLH
jgi:glycosyltransferase involved in cell wall biosynthesis